MASIDTSNMSKGKAEALEVAEAARQTDWEHRSFVGEIFMGKLSGELVHPYPAQSPEDEAVGDELLKDLAKFLKEKIDPEKVDREEKLPMETVKGLAEMGLFAMKIPKKYGGLGLSQVNYNRAVALVASHCGSTAVWLSAHQSIGVPQPLKLFGTDEQKEKWLPRFREGAISAFALTENNAGSDPATMTTRAEPVEGGKYWEITGEKLWCTNGLVADVIVVMARTPDREIKGRMRQQITAFIVETNTPGFEITHRCHFMGIRAIENGVIKFNKIRVPAENIILGEGRGLKLALATLNTGRLTLPAASCGAARTALGMSRRWANHRVQWGAKIGKHDAIAQKLSRMASKTFAMDSVTWYASALADKGGADIRLEAAMAKLFCSEEAWRILDEAVQIRGGRGYENAQSLKDRGEVAYPLERMLRENRINLIIEGASEIMRLFIAREALDPHMKAAGVLINPKAASAGQLVSQLFKAGGFYALWYPKLWIPDSPFNYMGWGKLGTHMRYVKCASRKLARNLFHLMVLNGPGLEKRQQLLGRVVDIGVGLFAMSASCSRAKMLVDSKKHPSAVDLADRFCRDARVKMRKDFGQLWCNADKKHYSLAQRVLNKEFEWIEKGVMPIEDFPED